MSEKKRWKDLNIIEKIFLIVGVLCIVYLFLPKLIGVFLNTKDYIENSSDFILTNVKVEKAERIGYGFGTGTGTGKIIIRIQSQNKYYDLLYYEKDKSDHTYFDQNKISIQQKQIRNIIVKINLKDCERYPGKEDFPIPVFNFRIENTEKYAWDEESYERNVKTYLVYEKILQSNIIGPILFISAFISFLLFCTYRVFVIMNVWFSKVFLKGIYQGQNSAHVPELSPENFEIYNYEMAYSKIYFWDKNENSCLSL